MPIRPVTAPIRLMTIGRFDGVRGMNTRALSLLLALPGFFCCAAAIAHDAGPALGEPVGPHELEAHNAIVFPDGEGLPPGSGSAAAGAVLYRTHCVTCHGPDGRGGPGGELAGATEPLTSATPDQTIGTYWPYATTLFGFIRRAMPLNAPGSLSDDEVYALCAYLLALNGIIAPDASLDATSLAGVVMPNRDGFIGIDAEIP